MGSMMSEFVRIKIKVVFKDIFSNIMLTSYEIRYILREY